MTTVEKEKCSTVNLVHVACGAVFTRSPAIGFWVLFAFWNQNLLVHLNMVGVCDLRVNP